LGAKDDQTIRISNFLGGNESVQVIEAIEVVEAVEVLRPEKSLMSTSESRF
jgi:hypothetical protein